MILSFSLSLSLPLSLSLFPQQERECPLIVCAEVSFPLSALSTSQLLEIGKREHFPCNVHAPICSFVFLVISLLLVLSEFRLINALVAARDEDSGNHSIDLNLLTAARFNSGPSNYTAFPLVSSKERSIST